MTTRQRRRTREPRENSRPYQSLWEGLDGEPPLPEEARAALSMLDDGRSAELWLREQAVTIETPDDSHIKTSQSPNRKYLTGVGWTDTEDGTKRSVIFDDERITEDDIEELTEYAISCAVHEMNMVRNLRSGGRRTMLSEFHEACEDILISLADEQSLTPSEENDSENENGIQKPSGYGVEAEILNGRTYHATMVRQIEDTPIRQRIAVNTRVQLCLDWLCRNALLVMNDDPISRAAYKEHDKDTGESPEDAETTGENGAQGKTRAPAATNTTDPGDASGSRRKTETGDGAARNKPPAPGAEPSAGRAKTGVDGGPARPATKDAPKPTTAQSPKTPDEPRAGKPDDAQAKRPGTRSDSHGSRYRYH